jgi:Domain of unknown function (DUF4412)
MYGGYKMNESTHGSIGNCIYRIVLPFCLCGGLIANQASADWIVIGAAQIDKADQNTVTQSLMFRVRGKYLRIDIGDNLISIIVNTQNGNEVIMTHAAKLYQKLSANEAREMQEKAGNYAEPNPPKAVDTGKTSKINGFDVEEYTAESPNRTQTLWVAKNVPHFEELRDLTMAYAMGAAGNLTVDPKSLLGYPVRIETDVTAHKVTLPNGDSIDVPATKTVQDITVIRETKLDDSIFDVPKDYKELPLSWDSSQAKPQQK